MTTPQPTFGVPASAGPEHIGDQVKSGETAATIESDPAHEPITPLSLMREVLEVYPGAQRALFRRYHIGGCSSCAFQPDETLEQVCHRNGGLNVDEVLGHIQSNHEQDGKNLI